MYDDNIFSQCATIIFSLVCFFVYAVKRMKEKNATFLPTFVTGASEKNSMRKQCKVRMKSDVKRFPKTTIDYRS